MSFGARVALWTGLFVLGGLIVFGVAFLGIANLTAQRLFDEALLARAQEASRGPGFGMRMGGPGRGPDRGPGPMPRMDALNPGPGGPMEPPGPLRGFRLPADAPRFVDRDGEPMGPPDALPPWDPQGMRQALAGRATVRTVRVDGEPRRVASVPVRRREGVVGAVQIAAGMDALDLGRQAQVRTLALALPIAALAALGIATVLTRLVVGPVRRLTQTAEAVAQDPLAPLPPLPEGTDEMGRLGGAFGAMTLRLQDQNRSLASALEGQRRLTSDASHELRTPLTRLMLALENARAPETTPEESAHALAAADRAAQAMHRLVHQLLTLARADGQRLELHLRWVDLREVASDALNLSGLAEDSRVRVDLPDQPMRAFVDPDATAQILLNLLTNAARYTPSDRSMTLGGKVDEGRCRLWVRDEGPGIPIDQRERVFERFARVDDGRARRDGGAGLGLAIGRDLARAQGAELRFEPTPGGGATFFVLFSSGVASSQDPHVARAQ